MVQKEVQTPEAVSFFDKLKSVFGAVYPENAQETDEESEENEDELRLKQSKQPARAAARAGCFYLKKRNTRRRVFITVKILPSRQKCLLFAQSAGIISIVVGRSGAKWVI